MHRLNLFLVALFSVGSVTTLDAAPPTEQDWWTGVGRYAGTFDLVTDQSDEPAGQFTMRWEVPFKITEYAFHGSSGNSREISNGFFIVSTASIRSQYQCLRQCPRCQHPKSSDPAALS